MFILCVMVILFIMAFYKMMFDRERIYVTYDTIDDAIVSSLTASCKYNYSEFGLSGQVIIYRKITPVKIPDLFKEFFGEPQVDTQYNPLEDPAITSPNGDSMLNDCYSKFISALKRNMRLDNNFVSASSGLAGPVAINRFSVFNKYEQRDSSENVINYKFVEYKRMTNGNWECIEYPDNTKPSIYNSFDKTTDIIEDTSVVTNIATTIRISELAESFMPEKTEADMTIPVTYQRIVAIKR